MPICFFQPVEKAFPDRQLLLRDFAYDGQAGLYALLGFLYKLSPQYTSVSMELPPDLPLDCLIDDLYEIKTLDRSSWMARLVDVEAGLQGLKCPKGDWQCTIRLLDSFLPYNSGVYQLVHSGDELEIIKVKGDTVDLSLSIQALTQLCLGYLSLDMALLRDDTTLYGNRALLSKLFAARPVYMAEKF